MTSQEAQPAGPRTARPARPPRADAVRNRARVLEAARAAFAAEGVAVPLDEIARRAGVGAGTVYRHFPTKEALFEAVIADQLAALAADAESRLAGAGEAGEQFFEFFVSVVDDGTRKADLADALSSAGVGLRQETLAAAGRLQAGLAELLERAQRAGAVRADVDTTDLHALAVGALAAERKRASGPGAEPGKLARIICDGLRLRD
ncbi:MAG TPA: TetR family transcriptional regulator [Actinospica sp.]|nr:TetR family transcriptional regulator [Actinospica sp.]